MKLETLKVVKPREAATTPRRHPGLQRARKHCPPISKPPCISVPQESGGSSIFQICRDDKRLLLGIAVLVGVGVASKLDFMGAVVIRVFERLLQYLAMNIAPILAELKAERDQLDRAITALEYVTGSSNRGSRPRTRRKISAEGLARIRAAQKARWAK